MKSQNIDTLQWTPSERLRKVLFVKTWEKRTKFNKSFAEALTSAKRCFDVRVVEEFPDGSFNISYLNSIGVKETGQAYMLFESGGGTWEWSESAEEEHMVSPDIPIDSPDISLLG